MTPAHYLRPLLAPKSVALIGASSRAGSLGRVVYENLLEADFQGALFAVNPNHAKVLGRKAFRSLRAIEQPVELAVIVAPPETVPAIISECGGRARAAAILSGAPAAGAGAYWRWRRELAARARAAGIRMLGPASFGIIRTSVGLNATFGAMSALRGRLTLISQSGAVASALLDFARGAGIGLASVAVLGAAGDVDFGEILEFALADPETDGIVLYVETLRDARVFLSALRAAARTKPVVVLRSGRVAERRSALGRGTLIPDRVFDAALKRAGTVRVHTYTQLFAAATILAASRVAHGHRLAIVSNGRGPGLMAADRAADTGVALAGLCDDTRAALAALLPRKRALDNPCDIEGEATPEQFAAAVRSLLADRDVDAVLALHVAMPSAPPTDTARSVADAAKGSSKPVLGAWLGSLDRPESRAALEAGGIVNFYTPENAVEAFSFVAAYHRNQEWLLEVPPPQPELGAPDLARALRVRARAIARARTRLSAAETRSLLAAFGIAVAPLAAPQDFAPAASGAVQVGAYTDAVFGPIIAFGGAAASAAELSLMLPPLNRRLAIDLIKSARAVEPVSGLDPLVALLLRVSTLVCVSPWVVELELSPILVTPGATTVAAARALIDAKRPAKPDGYRHMAIHPYPAELETTLSLKSGAELRVRPIRPEDAAMERAFVAELSEQSRYLRFMQHLPGLTPQMLARFTQVDYDRELALVALDGEPGAEVIVAVARYVANWDGESAEFAIAVADACQGRGLGYALMHMLVRCARKRGFKRLVGSVLVINKPMLALCAALGFVTSHDPNDPEQVIVTLELRPDRKQRS